MTALDLRSLSLWINGFLACHDPVPRVSLVRQDDSVLCLAENLGVLGNVGIASNLACTVCADEPHTCRVVCAPDSQYRFRCLVNGWIDVRLDEVTLLVFDRRSLLAALAEAAGSQPDKMRLYADDRLVQVGFIRRSPGADGWIMAYADGLENENNLAGVIDALAGQFPKGPGLIATPSVIPLNLPLPKGYRLIALHELAFGHGDQFMIDHKAAEIRLGRQKKTPGQPGRPSQREITREIWATLSAKPDWPSARKEQADLVLSHWPKVEQERPELGTIQNQIRDFERETGRSDD